MNTYQLIIVAIGFLIPIYFIPSVVAYHRMHKHSAAIYGLNFLLGWTGIGWIIALVWSLMDQKRGVA